LLPRDAKSSLYPLLPDQMKETAGFPSSGETMAVVWKTECLLVRSAVEHLRSNANDSGIIFEEHRTSYGRPDILEIAYDEALLAARLRRDRSAAVITKDSAWLLSILDTKAVLTEKDARQRLQFTPRRFDRALAVLDSRHLVCCESGGMRILESRYLVKSIKAYEAKLKDWTKAIAQAQRHLWFADESLVILSPISENVCARVLTACQAAGVGLAICDGTGLQNIQIPEPCRPSRSWLNWYLNETVCDIKDLDDHVLQPSDQHRSRNSERRDFGPRDRAGRAEVGLFR
jgi:hypothetical protein